MIIEACVESLEQATLARAAGADQLELCARLDVGGLTPEFNLVEAVSAATDIPVKIMIRPRAGDFVFSPAEVRQMQASLELFYGHGHRHFVIGLATAAGKLDWANIERLCSHFPTASFTLHKVIDSISDPLAELARLNTIPNIHSILTSGGAATALEGASQIMALRRGLSPTKQVIAAGRITADNLHEVQQKIKVEAYHGRRILPPLMSVY